MPKLNVMRIGWPELAKLPVEVNGAGHLKIRVMGTAGADDIVVDAPAATCPPNMRWMIAAGVGIGVFGGPGADRLTSTIGTVLDVSYYGDNGDGGPNGAPSIGNRRAGGGDLIQASLGGNAVGGPGDDIIDLHGIVTPDTDITTVVLHTKHDKLFVPSDDGFTLDAFVFAKIRDDGMAKLQRADATFHASNKIISEYEVRIVPTQRDTEKHNNVWLDVGDGSKAEQRAAVTDWLEDSMDAGGAVDQWIY